MRKALVGVALVALVTTGCTGSFMLTRKVYDFHRSQTDKWMDEIFFLVVTMIPVYSLATTADAIIFNSIEFWTGDNPITDTAAVNDQPYRRVVAVGDQEMVVSYSPLTDQISVASGAAEGHVPQFVLERSATGVAARDANGAVVFTSSATPDGGIAVYNQAEQLVKRYSAREVHLLKEMAADN